MDQHSKGVPIASKIPTDKQIKMKFPLWKAYEITMPENGISQ